jgi:hypothetical protein
MKDDAIEDPRRPSEVHDFERVDSEAEPDVFQLASSAASMGGMWFKYRTFCVLGLFLALVSFARGTKRDFSWQQFIAAAAFSVAGLFTAAMTDLQVTPTSALPPASVPPPSPQL